MIHKVVDFIKKYNMIEENDLVAAGVSGGADSLCLLYVLLEYRRQVPFDLAVVHVNHGIREEAAGDAAFVQDICEREKIPFFLREVCVQKIAEDKKISEEEAGRKIRYETFENVLEQCSKGSNRGAKIAVAHHRQDSAETLLFHLFRGTGIWGMSGILPVNGKIIRPLLCCSRGEIEEYLRKKGSSWCIDHTNEEDTYTRNKIRHHILSYADSRINPKSSEHIAGTALQMAQLREYLEEELGRMAAEITVEDMEKGEGVDLLKWKKYPVFLQNQFIPWYLNQKMPGRRDITSEHIEALAALSEKKGSKRLDLPGSMEAVKEYDVLRIRAKVNGQAGRKDSVESVLLENQGEYVLKNGDILEISLLDRSNFGGIEENKYTKYFDYDKINSCLCQRFRQTGDYLAINDKGQKKSLKEYFIHEKIPVSIRGDIPVVADGNHILWIMGYRISAYYKITAETKNIIQMRWRRKEHGGESQRIVIRGRG